jgi:hypothetical protein
MPRCYYRISVFCSGAEVMAKKTVSKKTGRGSEQFQLRMPDGMREQLAEVAEREGRSMNAVIVTALALYFAQEGMSLSDRVKNDLRDMQKAIERLIEEVAELRQSKLERKLK